jgi:hypothetical protein
MCSYLIRFRSGASRRKVRMGPREILPFRLLVFSSSSGAVPLVSVSRLRFPFCSSQTSLSYNMTI